MNTIENEIENQRLALIELTKSIVCMNHKLNELMNFYQLKEADKILKNYKDIANGYCVFRHEKWIHNHMDEISDVFKFVFEKHEYIRADSFAEALSKANKFIENISTESVDNPV